LIFPLNLFSILLDQFIDNLVNLPLLF